jgi:hypothetical protein
MNEEIIEEIVNRDDEKYYIEFKNNEFNYYYLVNGIFYKLDKRLVEYFGIKEDVCMLYSEIFN